MPFCSLIAAIVHFAPTPIYHRDSFRPEILGKTLELDGQTIAIALLVLVACLAFLMVSTIRYASFKVIPLGRRQHSLIIVAVGLLVWSIVVYSEIVLLLIAASYTVAGLTIHVVRLVRHRLVSRTA